MDQMSTPPAEAQPNAAGLGLRTLHRVAPTHRPPLDPADLSVGVVHLGIGAFHRGHQAVFTEDAMVADGSSAWGICGVTERSDDVVRRLRPQDGLYSLLQRDAERSSLRVVGSVREVLFARDEPDALIDRVAAHATRIISTTVTEKGYHHDPATGHLLTGDEETASDLAGRPPRTVVGQIAWGLDARRRADAGPLTVLCCDNLSRNGATLQGLVEEFCDRLPGGGDHLREWIGQNVTFPSSMVDRIVPATTEHDLAEVVRRLGLQDNAVVTAEPFRQWVLEDNFATARPAYDRAGVLLVANVAPYETVKLRLLNGTNSALAYLGGLAGLETIAEAAVRDELGDLARRLMEDDVSPTIDAPAGLDLAEYCSTVLERFANPALRHRTAQVAMDGSQKLPQRLLDPIRCQLDHGVEPYWATLAVAAWMRYVWAGVSDDGAPLPLQDPLAARLRALTRSAAGPAAVVANLLSLTEVFGEDLPDHVRFRQLLSEHLDRLSRHGVLATVRDALTRT